MSAPSCPAGTTNLSVISQITIKKEDTSATARLRPALYRKSQGSQPKARAWPQPVRLRPTRSMQRGRHKRVNIHKMNG